MAATLSDHANRRALRVHGRIARDIGVEIVTGRYRPGDILTGEIAASDELNVSRTAYREAVRILSAKGLVESRPKIGTRVSRRADWHLLDPDVLEWMFQHEPDAALLEALFELRRIVEPEAAALAASRRDETQLAAMQDALERMEHHTLETDAGRRADQDFHAALLDAAGNAFLASLTSGVGAAIAWTTVFKQRKGPLKRDALPDHRRVFEAVATQDAAAAHQAMATLIDMAFQDTTRLENVTAR
ncbi:MAG TPA: FadR/GntR family transcriptional regulator [Sphingomonas sp.]|nr:FadR/GntR family transcriptional regulator [Sphingomonas sp.]